MNLKKIAEHSALRVDDETTYEGRPITKYDMQELFLVRNYLTYIVNNYLKFYKELTPETVLALAIDFLHTGALVTAPSPLDPRVIRLTAYMEIFFGKNKPIEREHGKRIYTGGIISARKIKKARLYNRPSTFEKKRDEDINKIIERYSAIKDIVENR